MRYAHIAVNRDVDLPFFTYHIPDHLALSAGHLVLVPLRTGREAGIVVSLTDEKPRFATKPVLEKLDPLPVLTPIQLTLGRWLSENTLAPLGMCLWLMLPPGLTPHSDQLFSLSDHPDIATDNPFEAAILALLAERGPLRGRNISALVGSGGKKAAQVLAAKGFLSAEPALAPPVLKPKVIRTVQLTVDEADIAEIIPKIRSQYLRRILETLIESGGALDVPTLYAYTGANASHLEKLAQEGLIFLGESEIWRDSLAHRDIAPDTPPTLTPAQQNAWAAIRVALDSPEGGQFLLHGITGSGKTELYLQAVAHVLRQGRGAVVLVPEIALTAQMVRRFLARFPAQVGLIHSTLSAGERYDTWRRARDGQIRIVVGPRSALFAPLPDVGLVILDEEHDDSYKQSPQKMSPPYYHARETALNYMQLTGGTVILGSATPDIVTMHQAHAGRYRLLTLPERIAQGGHSPALPPVQIVDMRQELRAGHTSIFSRPLIQTLTDTLTRGEQAILFLNRRGTASYVFCRDCGYIAKCSRCDTTLTYHDSTPQLTCHHCGHHTANLTTCPECQSRRIKYFNAGTEMLEKRLAQEFPQARIQRWDADTAIRHDDHERIYHAFAEGRANVLVGTQMITKGLDLPNVTLVGIVAADIGLGLPDYRAPENTFQLLTQVAGRAGRGLLSGRVILQTYQPSHYAIQAAAGHDYTAFYQREIGYREDMWWPPYTRLARVLFRHPDPARVESEARRVAQILSQRIQDHDLSLTSLVGPVPCFYTRLDKITRWHILVRSSDPAAVLRGLSLGDLATVDIDPTEIL